MRAALIRHLSTATVPIAIAMSALGLIVIAAIDLATGTEVSLSLFYLGPIAFFAWRTGAGGGVIAAVVGAATWYGVDTVGGHVYSHPFIPLWNAFVRMGFFVIVGLLLVKLRRAMEHEAAMARTDPLTGLLNRRAFADLASREIDRARRSGLPLSFSYIDLDDFKEVNDRMGHGAGDEVLRSVARAVDLVLRNIDLKARLGGDEFALVMPDADAGAAAHAIDRLVAQLSEAGVRASVGTVVFESPPPDVKAALAAVDALMYEVKANPALSTAIRVDAPHPVVSPSIRG